MESDLKLQLSLNCHWTCQCSRSYYYHIN